MKAAQTSFFYRTITVFILALAMFSCLKSNKPGLPLSVVEAISKTGFNRIELTKTIGHFIESGDSLQMNAAFFLVGNLTHHYSVEYEVQDSLGNTYNFDPLSFKTWEDLLGDWNRLDAETGGLAWYPVKFQLDRDTVKAPMLIESIESGLSFPWLSAYTPADAYGYIIPYRIGNELVDNWRTEVLSDYRWFLGKMDIANPVESLISLINNYVDSNYVFDKRFIKEAHVQNYKQIRQTRRGNFDDLAYHKIRLLRSFGIPSALDYTPYLADTNYGLSWAVAMDVTGKFNPLLPPGTDYLFKKPGKIAKVYRRIFHSFDNSLHSIKPLELTTPPFLGHYHYLDVTSSYLSTTNLAFDLPCTDTLLYIAVKNDGKWKAIDWTICRNNMAVFEDAAVGVSFRPAYMVEKQLVPFGEPKLSLQMPEIHEAVYHNKETE